MSTEKQVISKEVNTPEKKESKEIKEFKSEKCPDHNWKPLLFYCSCGKFLCVLCLKNHSHDNMNFCDIKTFYNNVLTEMEQILKLIDRYSSELSNIQGSAPNKKLESIIYTKNSLMNDLIIEVLTSILFDKSPNIAFVNEIWNMNKDIVIYVL